MSKLSDDQVRLRLEIREIAKRVQIESGVPLEQLGDVIGLAKSAIWYLLTADAEDYRPITLDVVLAWSRHPDTQEFARRLLVELITSIDAQQLRLTDLQRFADSPFPNHNRIALTVVRDLAERCGLLPANTTNTAEVVAK